MGTPESRPSGIRPPGFHPEIGSIPKELTIIDTYDFLELTRRLKEAPIKDKVIFGFCPYRPATITLESIPIGELHPCSLYVLKPQLYLLGELRRAFLNKGVDILNLHPNMTVINYQWGDKSNQIMPPIVEVSEDDGGTLIVTDGLHRVILAKELGSEVITVAKIESTAAPLPVLPVEWDEVAIYEEVPPTKRRFRLSTVEENWRWISDNPDRFLKGLNSPENSFGGYFFYRSLQF